MHRDEPIVPIGEITKERTSELVPIEVTTYDGYKADQRPVGFSYEGRAHEVVEILFAWIEENPQGTTRRFCYEIVADPGRERLVVLFAQPDNRWYWRKQIEENTA